MESELNQIIVKRKPGRPRKQYDENGNEIIAQKPDENEIREYHRQYYKEHRERMLELTRINKERRRQEKADPSINVNRTRGRPRVRPLDLNLIEEKPLTKDELLKQLTLITKKLAEC